EAIAPIIALVVLLVFRALESVEKRLTSLAESNATDSVISGGVTRVYQVITEVVKNINEAAVKRGERRIDVIGLTLFSAWPDLEGRIRNQQSSGWRIRMLCLEPEYITSQTTLLDPSWALEATKNIDQIRSYLSDERETLRKRRITVELYTYQRIPAIHGFAIGDSDVVISFCHWDKNGRIDRPYQFYEHFPTADASERAEFYRGLFRNSRDELLRSARRVVRSNKGRLTLDSEN
ncbi:MAG TPA: hypothetical protein VEZ11_04905, partial [Thermoanaerobaculia bacterium]|nr:hypothetical protein [Thermoanaerobaculia bacterium]